MARPTNAERDQRRMLEEAAREPVRDPSPVLKKGEYRGRNGEVLRREKQTSANLYDFPDSIKEDRWSYQWCRVGTLGNTDGDHNEIPVMERAGWRPVTPEALNGYFLSENKGRDHIVRDGLMLMERPIEMTLEAQSEAKREADAKFQKSLGAIFDDTYALPSGFVADRGATRVERDGYEPSPQNLKPSHIRRAGVPVDE